MAAGDPPPFKILPVTGEAIIVQMREVVGAPKEVILHITRNGKHEERFTETELRKVLSEASTLLNTFVARVAPGGVR